MQHLYIQHAYNFFDDPGFDLWLSITQTAEEITNILAPEALKVLPRWKNGQEGEINEGHAESAYDYMQKVNEVRKAFDPKFKKLFFSFTERGYGKEWHIHPQAVQLLLAIAYAAQEMRHNPAEGKGPGMVFVNPAGEPVGWEAGNYFPATTSLSREQQEELLKARTRFGLSECGERCFIRTKLNVKQPDWNIFLLDTTPLTTRYLNFMTVSTQIISHAAFKSSTLRDFAAIITDRICGECIEPILYAGINRIITDRASRTRENYSKHRKVTMQNMHDILPENVIHEEVNREAPFPTPHRLYLPAIMRHRHI
jgi:hypothetical protein